MATRSSTLCYVAGAIGGALAARAIVRKRRTYSVAGKIVLITGGSRGLGLELARLFASGGARLALCARNEEDLGRARAEIEALGAPVFTVSCNLANAVDIEIMLDTVRSHYGQIDVLVNNAGLITVGPAEEMTIEDYEEAMRIHFWAPLHTIRSVAPEMKTRHQGRIVNIASIGGKIAVPHLLPYSASKFALVGLSEGFRAELAEDGVFVTTVCPGLMRTGSHVHAQFKGHNKTEATLFSVAATSPLTAINSESAARRIYDACIHGDAEVIFPLQAQAGVCFHGLFPGLTADLLGLVNRFMPGPGGIGAGHASGAASLTPISEILTGLGHEAALRNNETQ